VARYHNIRPSAPRRLSYCTNVPKFIPQLLRFGRGDRFGCDHERMSDAPTAVTDFTDDDVVRSYRPEAAELAKCITGAAHAHIFDHQLRQREAGAPS
jgi:hypothetical protein